MKPLISILSLVVCACGPSDGDHATPTPAPSASSDASGTGGVGGASDGGGTAGAAGALLAYPAFVPDTPLITSAGGPMLIHPRFVAITFPGDPLADSIEDFFAKMGGSAHWKTAVGEYGVEAGSGGPPIRLAEPAPASIDDESIQAWLADSLDGSNPVWGTADEETIYAVFYPQTTAVTTKLWGTSCQGFGAYHWHTYQKNGKPLVYVVVPRCPNPPGTKQLETLTYEVSHELLEATTDPLYPDDPALVHVDDDHLIWYFFPATEISDLCQYEGKPSLTPSDVGYPVARAWSNSAAKQGHDPCVPSDPLVPYFNSVPLGDDEIVADFSNGTRSTRGVKMAVGETRTVDVELFSDQPTSGPWKVVARDLAELQGKPAQLGLALAQDHGQNGDTLKLTITLKSKALHNLAGFVLFSSLGQESHVWTGVVGTP
jgi:hypothetical protein